MLAVQYRRRQETQMLPARLQGACRASSSRALGFQREHAKEILSVELIWDGDLWLKPAQATGLGNPLSPRFLETKTVPSA